MGHNRGGDDRRARLKRRRREERRLAKVEGSKQGAPDKENKPAAAKPQG